MKKTNLAIASLVTMATLSSLGSNVYASEKLAPNQSEVKNHQAIMKSQGAITNIDEDANKFIKSYNSTQGTSSLHIQKAENITTDPSLNNGFYVSGVNIKETNVTNVVPIFLGSNTFINNTSLDQTYNTSEFSESITKTKSTTTTHGFSSSTSVGGKVKIPFVAEGEVSETLEYNFSNANEQSTSETVTLTAPSQPVIVPANKTYKAEVYFEKKKTSGEVTLFGDLLQWVRRNFNYSFLSDFYKVTPDKVGFTVSPDDEQKLRKVGSGKFSIEYGTNLIVKTYDTSKPNSKKLVKTETYHIDKLY